MNKRVVTLGVACCIVLASVAFVRNGVSKKKQQVAEKVVKCLYDFGSTEQLEANQRELRSLVTKPVYNQLTYDSEERRLNTYLKFNSDSSTVNVLRVTDSCIFYELDCASIESGRHFVFNYKVNGQGKICNVYEAELIDFIAGEAGQWDW